MNFVFRVDASNEIGTGHVMRCLTLANELKLNGVECIFICRNLLGNLSDLIIQKGFKVHLLPNKINLTSQKKECLDQSKWLEMDWITDSHQTIQILKQYNVDWLIVDHYDIGYWWESELRPYCNKLMVIDDLANRKHDCDLLLDQNYYHNLDRRYIGLLPKNCKVLLGLRYLLLRNEFRSAREKLKTRIGSIKRILVFFGGSDYVNQTEIALAAIKKAQKKHDLSVDVVVGALNAKAESILKYCNLMTRVKYHQNTSKIANLVSVADLGIGAGGSAMWERCYLGLPTITISYADNQSETTQDASDIGAIKFIGSYKEVSEINYFEALINLIECKEDVKRMSNICLNLFPAKAGNEVVELLLNP